MDHLRDIAYKGCGHNGPGLNFSFLGFSGIYIVLAVTLIILLLRVAREPLPKLEWPIATAADQAEEEVEG